MSKTAVRAAGGALAVLVGVGVGVATNVATSSPTAGWVIGLVVLTALAVAIQIGLVMVEDRGSDPSGSPGSSSRSNQAFAVGKSRVSQAGGNIGMGGSHVALIVGVVGVLVVAGVAAALILVPAKGHGQDAKGTASSAAGPLSSSAPALLAAVEVPADTRECENAWSDSNHQTLTGGSKVGVTLQAPVGQTIVLRELNVQVMRTSAPITNRPEPTEDGCGGATDQRWFTVRLRDRNNATVLDTTNAKADPATAGTLPLTIKNDEPEQLYFRLDASAYTYEFRIVMRLANDGTSYTQTLDNGGRPFRVTPDPRPAK